MVNKKRTSEGRVSIELMDMTLTRKPLLVAVLVCLTASPLLESCVRPQTEVLVVGTVHQRHKINKNYSYEDVVHILSTYDPDVVCVEIRPQDFRKTLYLQEMNLATIWGLANGKAVYGIDWWDDSNDRVIRDSLSATPEYQKKEKRLATLEKENPILTAFEAEYGVWKDQKQKGYAFWNGKEYNDYVREAYRLSMDVYGDSPFNLHYQSRNDSMMALINDAIAENVGARIVVLTGCEHKHYFDRALSSAPGVKTIEFANILPLKHDRFDPAVRAYFDAGDDLPYFQPGYPKDIDEYYRTKLIDLIHGPDMDFKPEIVPERNVQIADAVLGRWASVSQAPEYLDLIVFERGWISFLKRDYSSAITYLSQLIEKIENKTNVSASVQPYRAYRNIGLCYDMTGDRTKAIDSYVHGEHLLRESGKESERVINAIFRNYKSQPFQHLNSP